MLKRLFQWALLAILLTASDPSFAQRKGFGFGKRHHHGPAANGIVNPVSAVTYDTSIGNGVDASGFASLPLNTGASRYYVNSSTGSDANSCTAAKNPATPKATLSSGLSCLVSGNGDQLLVAQGTSGYTWPNYAVVSGFSPQYPTVIQSYDPADPTNEAKLGRAADPNRPVVTTAQFHIVGGTGDNRNYIAVRGMEFNPGNVADAGVINTADGAGTSNYLLFENDVFAYSSLTLDMMANGGTLRAQHIIVRNSALYGQWGTSLSDHAQGMYAAGVDALTVEDSVFWHNGWKIGDAWTDDPTLGGPTEFNHPIYAQSNDVRTMVRRNVFINASGDSGELKGGGIYQGNLSLSNPIGGWSGFGNDYSTDAPFGVYADGSYNAFVGDAWGYETINIRQGCNCGVHHNAFAHSDTSFGYSINGLMADDEADVYGISLPTYPVFDHNVLYQWGPPDQSVHLSSSGGLLSDIHATYTNNSWGDASSGSNVNNTSATFANAYTMSSLLSALGYPDLTTAQTAWTANPQLHGWENGPTLMLAGYGVTIPALSDLTTVTGFTAGIATTGQFMNTHDGSNITATNLPTCMTIFSDNRGWSEDGTCTAGTVTSTITETNGANVHNTTLTWTIGARPVLSGLTVTPGSTTATANFSTNVGSGNAWYEITTNSTPADWSYMRAGIDATGANAVVHGSQAITASGAQPTLNISGLTASTAYYLDVGQLDANNNPSVTSTYAFTTTSSGPPASNIALDFTHLDSSHLFTDTGCTTAATTDLSTVKCIKDTTSGIVATNSTGWVLHQNSGHPYLQNDGASSFATTTSVTFADATGQYAIWMTGQFSGSPNPNTAIVSIGTSGLMNPNPNTGANNCNVRSASASLGGAWSAGAAANTDQVYSCSSKGTSGTSGTVEAFVNNVDTPGTGAAAWSGTPLTASVLTFAPPSASAGRFEGLLIAKGDQTANLPAMQTYMAALHP